MSLTSISLKLATCSFVLIAFKASTTAYTTFIGFLEPSVFAVTFLIPASSRTGRTAPPAIIPVPFLAGFIIILEAPYSA